MHGERASALFDDAVDSCQTQSRSLPRFFGSEEWFKHVFDHLGRHPGARIADNQLHILARLGCKTKSGEPFVHKKRRRLDAELAAFGHCISGICGQIHQHLFDLPRVGLDGTRLSVQPKNNFNILSDQLAQHLRDFPDDLIHANKFGRTRPLPAEGQELARQSAGLICRPGDFGDSRPVSGQGGGVSAKVGGNHFRIPENDGQQIVEVVGDAAGKPPDALQLLSLAQLVFEVLATGKVDDETKEAAPAGMFDRHRACHHWNLCAVFAKQFLLVGHN